MEMMVRPRTASNLTVSVPTADGLGGEPMPMGIVPDDQALLEQALQQALACDVILLSGGTSKGEGDLSYRVVGRLGSPGIVAHGVALKPGKLEKHCELSEVCVRRNGQNVKLYRLVHPMQG